MKPRFSLSLGLIFVTLLGLIGLVQVAPPVAHSLGGAGVLHIAGASFVPESNLTAYLDSGNGGVAVTGGDQRYMHAPVLLPDGVQVSGFWFYYQDNHNPGNMTARLVYHNDPQLGFRQTLADTVSPVGIAGYGSAYASVGVSPIEIDNNAYNYEMEVYWSAGSSDLTLMSIKIFYTSP
jgi:hypothetical protein